MCTANRNYEINTNIILLLGALAARKDPDRIRGRSVGRELDRLSRGLCMKLPIHVSEGNRRPEAPIQAAKLASEGGITFRQHIPILTHWKEYKKDESHLRNYIGKIGVSEIQFCRFHESSINTLH
jgi:hypothetical protein